MTNDLDSSEDDEMVCTAVKYESDDEGKKIHLSLMLEKMIHGLWIVVSHII